MTDKPVPEKMWAVIKQSGEVLVHPIAYAPQNEGQWQSLVRGDLYDAVVKERDELRTSLEISDKVLAKKIAKAEALVKALEPFAKQWNFLLDHMGQEYADQHPEKEMWQAATDALAAYKGEKK